MQYLKQSVAAVVSFGPAVSAADGFTPQTGLVGTGSGQLEHATTGIKLSKNGGAKTIRHATATASTHTGDGDYLVTLDTTDTNTLGRMRASFPGSATLLPIYEDFMVLPANVWDSLVGNTDTLMVDIASINNVAGNAALLAAMCQCGIIGTVSATGGDATHFQCGDITEATANHYKNKQAWVISGTLIKQYWGVIGAYALTGGEGRFTLAPGSASSETLAAGATVWII